MNHFEEAFLLCIVASAAAVMGCSDGDGDGVPPSDPVLHELRSDVPREAPISGEETIAAVSEQEFAWTLFDQVAEQQNLAFSPLSITTTMAMLNAGAEGETLSQLTTALRFPVTGEPLHRSYNALDQVLEQRNHPAVEHRAEQVLRVSSDFWLSKASNPSDALLETLAAHYGAGVYLAEFEERPDAVREAINAKVSEDTNGLIPALLDMDAVDSSTGFVLTSALYFKAQWTPTFLTGWTRSEPFFALDGSVLDVDMMYHEMVSSFAYARGEGWQLVRLPYSVGEIEMVVVMPDAGQFEAVRHSLTPDALEGMLAATEHTLVDLGFPKFEIRTVLRLDEQLMHLGMVEAFSPGEANLEPFDPKAFVSSVAHQATVVVSEQGTEAAAATSGVGGLSLGPVDPVTLTVDQPFVFVIRDVATGTILFLGQFVQPA